MNTVVFETAPARKSPQGRRDGKLEYDALINDAVDLRMKSAEEEVTEQTGSKN